MDEHQWFVVEDPQEYGEEPWDFDAGELAFVAALQARAASWRVLPAHSVVCRPEDDSSLLVHGTDVRAGKVCDQLFNLHEASARGSFHATGPVEELAERCASWFETVLSRPVSRTEWSHEGRVYETWAFAETLEGLVGGFNGTLAPAFHTGGGDSRARHDRCALLRGATEPQPGPHSPFCPYEPEAPANPRVD